VQQIAINWFYMVPFSVEFCPTLHRTESRQTAVISISAPQTPIGAQPNVYDDCQS